MRPTLRTLTITSVCALALASAPLANAATSPTARLAGLTRYDTAAAISARTFPTGAPSVFLVNGYAFADAVSAGTLNASDKATGPVLLVPGTGAVPKSVLAEIRRLRPGKVYAIGGRAVVSDQVLTAAAQGRPTGRLAGANRYETAAAVSRFAYPLGVYDGASVEPVKDTPTIYGILAGQIPGNTNIVLTPTNGPLPKAAVAQIRRVGPGLMGVVGGSTEVSPKVVSQIAAVGNVLPGDIHRYSGADRYATSVAVAGIGHPAAGGAKAAYIARGDVFADILAASSITDGPVLLVPKSGALPQSVRAYLAALHPGQVVAIGGTGAVSSSMLGQAKVAAGL